MTGRAAALVPLIAVGFTYLAYRAFFLAAGIHAMTIGLETTPQAVTAVALADLRPAAGKLGWSVTGTVFFLSVVATAVVLGLSIRHSLRTGQTQWARWIVATVIAAIAVFAALSWGDNPFTVVAFNPLLDQTFRQLEIDRAALFLDGFVPMIVAITVLLAAAASLTLLPARHQDAADPPQQAAQLRRRIRRLNTVLFAGAIVLVTAVVHASVTHRLPGVFCDADCAAGLDGFVNLLSASLGAVWTLILLAVYVPATWIVHNDAYRVARTVPANDTHQKTGAWLAERGLTPKLPERFLQAGALLGPLLAGGPAAPFLQLLDVLS